MKVRKIRMAQLKKRMVIDTETVLYNPSKELYGSNSLIYDIGFVVIDKHGTIYETGSYIVEEIFCNSELMQRAYFFNKIPSYIKDISSGKRMLESWTNIKDIIYNIIDKYNISEVWAFNANFDNGALLRTNKCICDEWEFFPSGISINCILRFAECNIIKQKSYIKFCERNNLKTNTGKLSKRAESVYRYITDNADFIEEHTALEDSLIEAEILNRCLRQHKKKKSSIVIGEVA